LGKIAVEIPGGHTPQVTRPRQLASVLLELIQ
jgi:hypothetical protein